MSKAKVFLIPVGLLLGLLGSATLCGAMSGTRLGPPRTFAPVPESIRSVLAANDSLKSSLLVEMPELPGHDDLIFDEARGVAFASGMDGWIWKLDLRSKKAARWLEAPLNPAGMQFADSRKERILFCASRLGGETYPTTARVGLYEAETANGQVRPILLWLPKTDLPSGPRVYGAGEGPAATVAGLDATTARAFALCNDLAVSKDGSQVFITEPFVRERAAMGPGAVPEAIGLFPHGKLWQLDRNKRTISLVMDGFTFVDGIVLEESDGGIVESVIISETTNFRIVRAFVSGPRRGQFEVLLADLPGMADGLERDDRGRIWIGIIKRRSGLMNFVHRHPTWKYLLLGLPQNLLPVSREAGVLVLDRTGKKPLRYVLHDGSRVSDISVAVPFQDRFYLPSFSKTSRGLFSVPIARLDLRE